MRKTFELCYTLKKRGGTNENRCTNLDTEPMTLHGTIDCQCS